MFGLDIILNNYHLFVLVSTLIYYIVLRFYKRNVLLQAKRKDNTSSNLIYITFVPILLYITRFLFLKSQTNINNYYNTMPQQSMQTQGVDKFIKTPYPDSTVSSASITI